MSAIERELSVLRVYYSSGGDEACVDEAEQELQSLRAALLAHAAQRDHTEDVLGMVQSVEQTPTPPTLASAARGVRSFLESTLRTNSKDVNDWREDVITAVKVLESIDGHGGNPSECPALLWQPTPPQSVELPEAVGTFYLDESTAQWSEYKRPPSVLTEGDSILYHEQALRTYGDAREAAGYARGLKEAGKDAERYRWLCDVATEEQWVELGGYTVKEIIDSAIDAALAGEVRP